MIYQQFQFVYSILFLFHLDFFKDCQSIFSIVFFQSKTKYWEKRSQICSLSTNEKRKREKKKKKKRKNGGYHEVHSSIRKSDWCMESIGRGRWQIPHGCDRQATLGSSFFCQKSLILRKFNSKSFPLFYF